MCSLISLFIYCCVNENVHTNIYIFNVYLDSIYVYYSLFLPSRYSFYNIAFYSVHRVKYYGPQLHDTLKYSNGMFLQ